MKVTLVLDTSYGEGLVALSRPFRVCDSPANRLAAERSWSQPNGDPMDVTVFDRVVESAEQICADILPTLDEHHPDWTEIVVVVGAVATQAVRACFAHFAPEHFLESPGGFTVVRSSAP